MHDWAGKPPSSAPPAQWRAGLPPSWPNGLDPVDSAAAGQGQWPANAFPNEAPHHPEHSLDVYGSHSSLHQAGATALQHGSNGEAMLPPFVPPFQAQHLSHSQPIQYHSHVHLHQHQLHLSSPPSAPPTHAHSQPIRPPSSWPSHPPPTTNGKAAAEAMSIDTTPQRPTMPPPPGSSPTLQSSPTTIRPADLMTATPTRSPSPPREDLPPAITLMHIATTHVSAARALVPSLIRSPSTSDAKGKAKASALDEDVDERARLISTYRRHVALAIVSLRTAVKLSASTLNAVEPPQELAARCMLAELLFDETDGLGEAETTIVKGLQKIQEKEKSVGGGSAGTKSAVPGDWVEWKWRLYEMSIRLALLDPSGNKITYARKLARKFAQQSSQDPRAVAWQYHFLILLADINLAHPQVGTSLTGSTVADADVASCLSVLREAVALAADRNDSHLYVALRIQECRLLLERTERARWAEVGAILTELEKLAGGLGEGAETNGEAANKPVVVSQVLKAQLLLLRCLYHSLVGDVKAAKDRLKQVHVIMDATEREDGEDEGILRIPIHPSPALPSASRRVASLPSSASPTTLGSSPVSAFGKAFSQVSIQSPTTDRVAHGGLDLVARKPVVELSTLPRGSMYTLTFLISAVIHPDPHGTKPKATLFIAEGLKQIEEKLAGVDASGLGSRAPLGDSKVATRTSRRVKIELCFADLQLAIMRSEFARANEIFGDLAALLQTVKLWDVYKARLMCLKGALAHASGNLEYAASCFLGSLHVCRTSAPRSLSLQDDVAVLSKASYVLVKVATGVRLRTRAKEGGKASAKRQRDEEEEEVEELEGLIQELKAEADTASPTGQLAAQVVDALTCGEIVRSKQHVSAGLNAANALVNSHMKAILLALLASLFVNTRNEQAFKMIHSSFKLANGFGSAGPGAAKEDGMKAHVGHASLGLWTGERLHQIYVDDGNHELAHKQAKHNDAHRQVLASTPMFPPGPVLASQHRRV